MLRCAGLRLASCASQQMFALARLLGCDAHCLAHVRIAIEARHQAVLLVATCPVKHIYKCFCVLVCGPAGKETVNTLYGTRVAVLAGDFLFAQSSWLIANLENMEVSLQPSRCPATSVHSYNSSAAWLSCQ